MEKSCELCGTRMSYCLPSRKYCKECAKKVHNTVQAKGRLKKKMVPISSVIICGVCGKPLVKKTAAQKYHLECSIALSKQIGLEYRKKKKKSSRERDRKVQPAPKPKYTLKQMNDKAKELGMMYGKYSLLLSQGKVDPPDER